MQNVQEIRVELAGSENKLADTLGHNREISRLLGLVEEGITSKDLELSETGQKLSLTTTSLETAQRDLLEAISESKLRKDEIEVLNNQLRCERAEVSALQARLNNATASLAKAERELVEVRTTCRLRKEEIDSLTQQLLKEKGQVSSLKNEVDVKNQKMKDLEARIVALEKKHLETVSQGESVKKDLERRQREKMVENESLKKNLECLERKARNNDANQILKSKEVLESSYKSLQRQYQAKEDELERIERVKEEYRQRLAVYDEKFEPGCVDKTFGLRGKAAKMYLVKELQ